jgi:hypothetical protein
MKILLVYYSRTGFTEKVMSNVKDSLVERGHTVEVEQLQVIKKTSCIGEILKDLHHYPLIFLLYAAYPFGNGISRTISRSRKISLPFNILMFQDLIEFASVVPNGHRFRIRWRDICARFAGWRERTLARWLLLEALLCRFLNWG